jgi:hypothetical protein
LLLLILLLLLLLLLGAAAIFLGRNRGSVESGCCACVKYVIKIVGMIGRGVKL